MKKLKCALLLAAALCCVALYACADTLMAHVPVKGGYAQILASETEEQTWLLLPSFASLETVSLYLDEEKVFLESAQTGDSISILNAKGETVGQTGVMRSENLRALFLFSDDPVNCGRIYIDGSETHETVSSGTLVMVDADGRVAHAAEVEELHGRGNSTWDAEKKPYSLKLDARTDLLDIGQPTKKWVLLADAIDGTLIRNLMTLELARELGIASTPHAEHVDLYYDGEYRGTYLLCEKTDVDEWGIDELDYGKLLKHLNRSIGIYDVEALPPAVSANAYGCEVGYTDGIAEANLPSSGAYWIETDSTAKHADTAWFTLPNGSKYLLENPKYASLRMVNYISERMAEAFETLEYGGVHPSNGRSIEENFDVDGFARMALLQELSCNPDGFKRSSFFVLPAGASRFETGPAWDFDLSWRYFTNLQNADGRELQKMTGWPRAFYGVETFWNRMGEIWQNELYPLIRDVLLGEERGRYLQPIDACAEWISASRRMNDCIWDTFEFERFVYGEDYEAEIELLKRYLRERSEWFTEELSTRTVDPEKVDILVRAQYMDMDKDLQVETYPWSRAAITEFDCDQVSDATEEEYALWRLEAVVQPAPGHTFVHPSVTVNDTPVEAQLTEDGNLKISVLLQDLSYRPADYYGEDMGMVFNAEYYASRYPEVAEMCENDPQLLLEYFCDEGMYEGHQGNAFFDPIEAAHLNPYLLDVLGEDWWLYYTEFISYGFDAGWLKDGKTFLPAVAE